MKDMFGQEFEVGQVVYRARLHGKTPSIEQSKVTRIECGKLYLDGSRVAINFPERLVITKENECFYND